MLKSFPYFSLSLFIGSKQIEIVGRVDNGAWRFVKLLSFDWNFKKISHIRNNASPNRATRVIASSALKMFFSNVIANSNAVFDLPIKTQMMFSYRNACCISCFSSLLIQCKSICKAILVLL